MIWAVTAYWRNGETETVVCFDWDDVREALLTATRMHCGWSVERFHA